jgi:hypothetical protein
MDNQTLSNNRFDKKDQLLEINPMALRLSGQSSARAFDEHPCDIFLNDANAASCNGTAGNSLLKSTPKIAYPSKGSELIFSSQFHTEHATVRPKSNKPQTWFFK